MNLKDNFTLGVNMNELSLSERTYLYGIIAKYFPGIDMETVDLTNMTRRERGILLGYYFNKENVKAREFITNFLVKEKTI